MVCMAAVVRMGLTLVAVFDCCGRDGGVRGFAAAVRGPLHLRKGRRVILAVVRTGQSRRESLFLNRLGAGGD